MVDRPTMGIPVGMPVRRPAQKVASLTPKAAAPKKKGAAAAGLKKLKKPMQRKSIKVAKYAQGGAVERFLAKYPDYKP